MKKVKNPLYKDEPELPDLERIHESLRATIDSLIDESINTFDGDALDWTEVKRDDMSGIRVSSDPNYGPSGLCGK